MKQRINDLLTQNGGHWQFVRFLLNGIFAAAVHYGVYYLCQLAIEVNISYTIGYLVSFLVNYYTTCRFTFRQKPTWKHFIGFSGSHAINYSLHVMLFWCCIQLGIHRLTAPILVMGIAMLVQFTVLRLVFRRKK